MVAAAGELGPLLEEGLDEGPEDPPSRSTAAAGGGRWAPGARLGAAFLASAGLAALWLAVRPGRHRSRVAEAGVVGLAEDSGREVRMARLKDMGAHRWGVNIHFTGSHPAEMAALAKAFKTVRIDLFWHRVEKAKGTFDFKQYEDLLADMENNDLQPLFILCYGNQLYGCKDHPRTPSCQEAFTNYAVTSMAHFAGHGIIWEFYNEPNGFWADWGRLRKETKREYPALVNNVMKRVRGDPAIANEVVIGPATSGVDVDFICSTGNVGGLDRFDAISAHPYRRDGPESVIESWKELRHRLEGYPLVANVPFVSSEWGWATCGHPMGGLPESCPPGGGGTGDVISGPEQAARLARQWLINDKVGISFSIWYDWKNDGDKPMNAEHNFGATLYNADYTREPHTYAKPSYLAAMTLQSLLSSLVYVNNPCDADGIFCLRYRHRNDPDGQYDKYAVWTVKQEGDMSLEIPLKECMKVVGLLGQNLGKWDCDGCSKIVHTACPEGGKVKMHVSSFPVYLVPDSEVDAAGTPMVAATVAPTPAPTAVPTTVHTAVPTPPPAAATTDAPPWLPAAAATSLRPKDADVVRFLRSEEAADMRADRVAWLRSMGSHRWGVGLDVSTFEPGDEAELAGVFSIARVVVSWAAVEEEKGAYDFAKYDHVVGRLKGQGVGVVASLCCGNELYGCGRYPSGGSMCRDAYVAYAKATISHFRGQNVIWEVFDEPNAAWADGEGTGEAAAQYALVLDALGQAVRLDADTSNEILVGPATAGIDTGFISAVGDTAAFKWLDGLSVKPAPWHGSDPGTFFALSQLASKYAPDGQAAPALLSTSSGWPPVGLLRAAGVELRAAAVPKRGAARLGSPSFSGREGGHVDGGLGWPAAGWGRPAGTPRGTPMERLIWAAAARPVSVFRSSPAGSVVAADPGGMVPLEEQASRLARQWLVHDACNVSVSLWSEWKDSGEDGQLPSDNYGVVLRTAAPLRPKPAYFAALAIKTLLGRKALVASCSTDDASLRCLVYAASGGARSYAVWSVAADQPRGLGLQLGTCLALVDMSLTQLGRLCPGQEQAFRATPQPQYLVPCEEAPSGKCEDTATSA
ncbi:unnamed protein product [Prorocentrum cordatum]|uniref:Glycoside hydrolase family 5 domain-containing protein n=1 Tax=Prorocentrum cordatum TaxID=2364126 RepID=A0ABN9Q9V7_9DINO|nr:unnamed protein product [Polarella glacialis]